jgi:hypothetical protein
VRAFPTWSIALTTMPSTSIALSAMLGTFARTRRCPHWPFARQRTSHQYASGTPDGRMASAPGVPVTVTVGPAGAEASSQVVAGGMAGSA